MFYALLLRCVDHVCEVCDAKLFNREPEALAYLAMLPRAGGWKPVFGNILFSPWIAKLDEPPESNGKPKTESLPSAYDVDDWMLIAMTIHDAIGNLLSAELRFEPVDSVTPSSEANP